MLPHRGLSLIRADELDFVMTTMAIALQCVHSIRRLIKGETC